MGHIQQEHDGKARREGEGTTENLAGNPRACYAIAAFPFCQQSFAPRSSDSIAPVLALFSLRKHSHNL